MKPIALLVNDSLPNDYKFLKPQKEYQYLNKNYENSEPNISDFLKRNYLFIGHHLIVNEVCHQHNLDLKVT